jgi:hypothetical protein
MLGRYLAAPPPRGEKEEDVGMSEPQDEKKKRHE